MVLASLTVCTRLCLLASLVLGGSGCAYQFTNKHVVRPEGVKTIAVEAIYDTSREVLPHEQLWKSLQDAFASDGHLRLASQGSADALVRAHIRKAAVSPTGGKGSARTPEKDPDPFRDDGPVDVSEFRQLTRQDANKIRDHVALNIVVDVEVWSLRTRTLLLKQTYPASDVFFANYYSLPSSSPINDHLRFEEATEARFKAMSEGIARGVVRDLLVR